MILQNSLSVQLMGSCFMPLLRGNQTYFSPLGSLSYRGSTFYEHSHCKKIFILFLGKCNTPPGEGIEHKKFECPREGGCMIAESGRASKGQIGGTRLL